tara:strand:+ start:2036 stop:2815 length:780 start_codon:yes stop_codon:yes gene_type:complete
MKFNDDITKAIAETAKDVLEGKTPAKKEEVKYPHKMYHPDTGEEVNVKTKDEHDEYTKKGYVHEKPVKEVEEPKAKGEKEFKAKHVVKKSGENPDGTVTKEERLELSSEDLTLALDEAVINERLKKKPGRGKVKKLDIDFIGDNKLRSDAKRKYKVDIKTTGSYTADISGEKGQIVKFLQDPDMYGMDDGDIEDLFPELFEAKEQPVDELSAKQKKYQAFFDKALKKFGVSSPDELEGEKKKEFFDYIDKNYKADNESD